MSSGDVQIPIDEDDQKVDEKIPGETSKNDTVTDEFDQEDEVIFQKLKKKNEQVDEKNCSNGQDRGSNQLIKIQRVPELMKADQNKHREYFMPKMIAIGPLYAKSETLSEGEELKLMWAAKYLGGLNKKELLQVIRGKIKDLKGHYDEKCFEKDAKDVHGTLERMLFVDGCAMLQFIYSFVSNDFVNLKINIAQATLVQQDLFLLENQIPFQVLQIISEYKQQKEKDEPKKIKSDPKKLMEMETAVREFIYMSNMTAALRPESPLNFDGAVHLLELLRRSLLDDSAQSDDLSTLALNCLQSFIKYLVFVIFKLPLCVLGFLVCLAIAVVLFVPVMCMIGIRLGSPKIHDRLLPSFRNAREMTAAGIKLKPSKGRSLTEVSFSSGLLGGCLQLCPILLDKSTAGKWLNLIAYEMCSGSKSYYCRISSHLSFLDSLIDNEQDVKELRAANILRHLFCSDKEVADLFNNISPISVTDEAYGIVISIIQGYRKNKFRIWMTELRQEYLRSPWTILALTAAAAALGLTATQTYFSIHPR